MRIKIGLEDYIKEGASVSQLDVADISYTGGDSRYMNCKITRIARNGIKNTSGTDLYDVYFENGLIKSFSPCFFNVNVSVCLYKEYFY
jgi:hypothetical protein